MSPELENKLIKKYPDLFRDVNKSPMESCMCWGTEFGDGWFDIMDNLCGYLTDLRKSRYFSLRLKEEINGSEYYNLYCPEIVFLQTKEKYGTLCIYWNFKEAENSEELRSRLVKPELLDEYTEKYYNIVQGAINFCEYLSSRTCEVTGRPGKLYTKGWCVTLCKEEAIKRFGFDPDEVEDEEVP